MTAVKIHKLCQLYFKLIIIIKLCLNVPQKRIVAVSLKIRVVTCKNQNKGMKLLYNISKSVLPISFRFYFKED